MLQTAVAVASDNLQTKRRLFYLKTQSVLRCKHSPNVIKNSQLMFYSEIIDACSQIHTKQINTLRGQNAQYRTYRAVNTQRLSYKNQPVNAVQ
jgi:hypothetical protein